MSSYLVSKFKIPIEILKGSNPNGAKKEGITKEFLNIVRAVSRNFAEIKLGVDIVQLIRGNELLLNLIVGVWP